MRLPNVTGRTPVLYTVDLYPLLRTWILLVMFEHSEFLPYFYGMRVRKI